MENTIQSKGVLRVDRAGSSCDGDVDVSDEGLPEDIKQIDPGPINLGRASSRRARTRSERRESTVMANSGIHQHDPEDLQQGMRLCALKFVGRLRGGMDLGGEREEEKEWRQGPKLDEQKFKEWKEKPTDKEIEDGNFFFCTLVYVWSTIHMEMKYKL
jgi:hypothetical protein